MNRKRKKASEQRHLSESLYQYSTTTTHVTLIQLMYFKRTKINMFDIMEVGIISCDNPPIPETKNWLKEKNLYKIREEKKILASRKK